LNDELTEDSVEIPTFNPLPEIDVIAAASPKGHYVLCPGCQEELRIHRKYKGMKVQCKHCNHLFNYSAAIETKAFYTPCPHCSEELRAAPKYMGHKVACKHCNGHIQLMPE
jgi:DNA-directed RNA polymerase subunit RPC12/RpoP